MKEPVSDEVDEDEQEIARSYRHWPWYLVPAFTPLGVAWFADEKTVIAVGFAGVVLLGLNIEGRLHDLCIRVRRTNLLLRSDNPPVPNWPQPHKLGFFHSCASGLDGQRDTP